MTKFTDFAKLQNTFDYDFSSKPWPASITGGGQETHGIVASDPGVTDAKNGDYRLKAGSPCIGKGTVVTGFTYSKAVPDLGAYDGNNLVEGPPFYTMVPTGGLGYVEKPRITRHRVNANTLTLFYSWPLNPGTISASAVILKADGALVTVSRVQMGATNREVVITTASTLTDKVLSLNFSTFPTGDNGETSTLWASTLAVGTGSVTNGINDLERFTTPVKDILEQVPNPFNSSTSIRFTLSSSSQVKLIIYDVLGKEVDTLINGKLSAGAHEYVWEPKDNISHGMYLCRLDANNYSKSLKMILTK